MEITLSGLQRVYGSGKEEREPQTTTDYERLTYGDDIDQGSFATVLQSDERQLHLGL